MSISYSVVPCVIYASATVREHVEESNRLEGGNAAAEYRAELPTQDKLEPYNPIGL